MRNLPTAVFVVAMTAFGFTVFAHAQASTAPRSPVNAEELEIGRAHV